MKRNNFAVTILNVSKLVIVLVSVFMACKSYPATIPESMPICFSRTEAMQIATAQLNARKKLTEAKGRILLLDEKLIKCELAKIEERKDLLKKFSCATEPQVLWWPIAGAFLLGGTMGIMTILLAQASR